MKPTKATLQQRLDEILEIRLCGATFFDARRYLAEKEAAGEAPWTIAEGGKPVSERTLWRYFEKTNAMIAQTCQEGRKRLLQRHLAQRRSLFAKCVNQGDLRAALSCLDSEAKLCGLFEDEVTRLIDQLQKEIAELKASHDNSNHPPPSERDASGPPHAEE